MFNHLSFGMIYPEQVKGWIVARTWPTEVRPSTPALRVDAMRLIKYTRDRWGCDFDTMNGKPDYAATVFPTFETAREAIIQIGKLSGWNVVFVITPTVLEPDSVGITFHSELLEQKVIVYSG